MCGGVGLFPTSFVNLEVLNLVTQAPKKQSTHSDSQHVGITPSGKYRSEATAPNQQDAQTTVGTSGSWRRYY